MATGRRYVLPTRRDRGWSWSTTRTAAWRQGRPGRGVRCRRHHKGLRGLDSVELALRSISPTDGVLTEVMGFREVGEHEESGRKVTVLEVGPGGPGARMRLVERPDLPPPVAIGAGGVHHVAFRTPDEEELARWMERVRRAGIPNSGLVERYYFKSLYFREPGGVLFEIATDGPGFAVDEDPEHLGEKLSLPPFLEGQRATIERGLEPIQPARDAPL